jgi:hypothetical protein
MTGEDILVVVLREWRDAAKTGSIALNFTQGQLMSLELRETRRIKHNTAIMSSVPGPGERRCNP